MEKQKPERVQINCGCCDSYKKPLNGQFQSCLNRKGCMTADEKFKNFTLKHRFRHYDIINEDGSLFFKT